MNDLRKMIEDADIDRVVLYQLFLAGCGLLLGLVAMITIIVLGYHVYPTGVSLIIFSPAVAGAIIGDLIAGTRQ